MKIAFLLPMGLERPSGIRYANLARGLVAAGHHVTVLALHPDFAGVQQRSFTLDGVAVRYVGQMHARKVGSEPHRFGPLQLLMVVLQSTLALVIAAVQLDVDCYHLGKPQPINGLAGLIASRLRRRPLYLDCDDYEAGSNRFTSNWQRRVFAWWEDRLPRFVQGITANTHFLAERGAALGTDPTRIVHVPNGVDLSAVCPPQASVLNGLRRALGLEDRRVIAYAGTLSLQNHPVDLLFDAMPDIVAHHPHVMLLIIGGGEDLALLRTQARARGLDQHIMFTGHVERRLVFPLLSLAECSVDPVHDDAVARARSPLKIFESLALGVPVVTGDAGDRREILGDGSVGILVQPGSASSLAQALIASLNQPERLTLSRATARQFVTNYDWNVLADRFQNVYSTAELK